MPCIRIHYQPADKAPSESKLRAVKASPNVLPNRISQPAAAYLQTVSSLGHTDDDATSAAMSTGLAAANSLQALECPSRQCVLCARKTEAWVDTWRKHAQIAVASQRPVAIPSASRTARSIDVQSLYAPVAVSLLYRPAQQHWCQVPAVEQCIPGSVRCSRRPSCSHCTA